METGVGKLGAAEVACEDGRRENPIEEGLVASKDGGGCGGL